MKLTVTDITKSGRESVVLAALLTVALLGSYFIAEPNVGQAIEDQFTVTQTVTDEISFLTPADNVVMNATIPGITGGTATGTTWVRVLTNNADGYTMTIVSSSSPAMQANASSDVIQDYTAAAFGTPDFTRSVGANTGEFAYTITASSTTDLAQKFLDDGGTCGTGGSDTNGLFSCWYGLSTTATSTINRTTATPASGSTSTLYFVTQITSNPAPSIGADTYVATTTLTAVNNP